PQSTPKTFLAADFRGFTRVNPEITPLEADRNASPQRGCETVARGIIIACRPDFRGQPNASESAQKYTNLTHCSCRSFSFRAAIVSTSFHSQHPLRRARSIPRVAYRRLHRRLRTAGALSRGQREARHPGRKRESSRILR